MDEEKIETSPQNIDEKLIKGYVDTVFNIWRMGKDANLNYEETKKRLDDINRILNEHVSFILQVDREFTKVNRMHGRVLKRNGIVLRFSDSFDLEGYIRKVQFQQKTLEKTLIPLKNLSKKYDRTLRILKKNGFQIVEFDGKKFNDGMSIKVLGYDSRSDIEEDIIIETVKPTIFFNGKEYLKGEVIVSKKPDDE
ncbi:hypothetical protein [Methanobrevibacter sp.]|uniref:hypothetical protein n=1 Tax=Methanobrevibacter sp. TaxID=66852 RepID=UPI00386B9C1C